MCNDRAGLKPAPTQVTVLLRMNAVMLNQKYIVNIVVMLRITLTLALSHDRRGDKRESSEAWMAGLSLQLSERESEEFTVRELRPKRNRLMAFASNRRVATPRYAMAEVVSADGVAVVEGVA